MKSKKLTLLMKKALIGLAASDDKNSAYDLRCSIGTLEALRVRGLAVPSTDAGSSFSPTTHRWICTKLGHEEAKKLLAKIDS